MSVFILQKRDWSHDFYFIFDRCDQVLAVLVLENLSRLIVLQNTYSYKYGIIDGLGWYHGDPIRQSGKREVPDICGGSISFQYTMSISFLYTCISFLNIIPFSTNAVNEYPFLTQAQRLLYEHIINNLHQQVSVDKVLTSHQDVKVIAYFFQNYKKSTSHPLVR